MASTTEGLVVRIDRKVIHVEIGLDVVPCTVRGRFFEGQDDDPESRPVAVGDRVRVEVGGERGAIEEVLERRSRIARPRPRDPRNWQVIAANVELLVIVASVRQPTTRPGLIDRMLVTAESEGIEPLIVLNKIDLVTDAEANAFAAPWRALGYRVVATSVPQARGIEELRAAMAGRVAMLLGHSGVGKSSLLAALDPAIAARIGGLVAEGTKMARGAHTTTSASMHRLAFGGHLIDTPGVREFGLPPMEPHDLAHWFRELAPLVKQCRYATCTHDHEPNCAVKDAVTAGKVHPDRIATYRKLLDELKGGGERMARHDSF
ncbi:MAG: ribosome small subunit-dependent GTPase A [Planctomycetes bacterium]|nr:ribosome small subunit-dependent GTPase A [Planctomycetota bacterium]